jgi:hypothetical protein
MFLIQSGQLIQFITKHQRKFVLQSLLNFFGKKAFFCFLNQFAPLNFVSCSWQKIKAIGISFIFLEQDKKIVSLKYLPFIKN